jgi:hypothetical protein
MPRRSRRRSPQVDPVNREDFRRIALSLPDAVEGSHQGSIDFRVAKKIFATFGPKDVSLAVLKLLRDQQEMLLSTEPAIFAPIPGAWGRQGWTTVRLGAADEATLHSVLRMAWRAVAPKRIAAKLDGESGPGSG